MGIRQIKKTTRSSTYFTLALVLVHIRAFMHNMWILRTPLAGIEEAPQNKIRVASK